MTSTIALRFLFVTVFALQVQSCLAADAVDTGLAPAALAKEITDMDSAAFDGFNHCSDPAQLQKYADYFAKDVEFYHDQGGVTWNRDGMIANTEKNVCGKYRRELIPGTVKVYPIKDFGAIELGVHQFCHFDAKRCEGLADFFIVWKKTDTKWEITRAYSYGHRSTS